MTHGGMRLDRHFRKNTVGGAPILYGGYNMTFGKHSYHKKPSPSKNNKIENKFEDFKVIKPIIYH